MTKKTYYYTQKNKQMKTLLTLFLQLISLSLIAQNCTLKGIVHDAQNNETLPYANIQIVNTNKITQTNENGEFIFKNLDAGFVSLQVSYVGYVTKQTNEIFLSNNNTQFIDIELIVAENKLQDINIRPSTFGKKDEAPISMQSISTREIESNPGSNRDISRVIQSFPGVGSTPAYRNDIIIRGGGPAENRFYLDGVEIPVLNHFATQGASGGPVGIINADFIRNVDFYSSSFPAAKYNALSGVLDFKQKDGNSDKMNMQFAIGASEASLTADGPIGEKTNYIVSVRRSYLQFLFSAIGLPFLPTFNDYQIRVKTNFNKKNQLSVISIGSLDNLTINKGIKNPSPSQEYIIKSIPINNQWSYTFGLVYKHFFDKGFHTLVLSRNMLNNELYKYPDNDESKAKSFDYLSSEAENKFRYEYHFWHNNFKYVLSAGLEYAQYYNNTNQKVVIYDQIVDLNYNTSLDLLKYGFSAQVTKQFFDNKLLTTAGVRFDGNDYNSNSLNLLHQFSPRISCSYSINSNNKINVGAGRYFQQAAYTSLGYRNNQGQLLNKQAAKYIGVNQYNIGIEHIISNSILISVEGFYKDYFNYPIDLSSGASLSNQGADYSIYGAAALSFAGKGKAYGIELLNRWNYQSFNILASYTFFRTLFTDINNNYIASAWDSKHLLTITATKNLKNNWRIGAKWRYVGALPYTPYDLNQSSNKEAWLINNGPYPDYSQLNAKRYKPFHQLDIRVDKNIFFKKWSLMLYFDLQNAYNFKSEGQDIILRKKNDDGTYVETNNGKNYVLESYENSSGTVLPTLGVMIKF